MQNKLKSHKVTIGTPYSEGIHRAYYADTVRLAVDQLQQLCHGVANESGWWTNIKTGETLTSVEYGATLEPKVLKVNIPEKLMLIVSEVAEAMEGVRKNLMDDKLPTRSMLEVELADAVIRIFDLAGGIGLDLPGALVEKLQFNTQREDHKLENRQKADGKAF